MQDFSRLSSDLKNYVEAISPFLDQPSLSRLRNASLKLAEQSANVGILAKFYQTALNLYDEAETRVWLHQQLSQIFIQSQQVQKAEEHFQRADQQLQVLGYSTEAPALRNYQNLLKLQLQEALEPLDSSLKSMADRGTQFFLDTPLAEMNHPSVLPKLAWGFGSSKLKWAKHLLGYGFLAYESAQGALQFKREIEETLKDASLESSEKIANIISDAALLGLQTLIFGKVHQSVQAQKKLKAALWLLFGRELGRSGDETVELLVATKQFKPTFDWERMFWDIPKVLMLMTAGAWVSVGVLPPVPKGLGAAKAPNTNSAATLVPVSQNSVATWGNKNPKASTSNALVPLASAGLSSAVPANPVEFKDKEFQASIISGTLSYCTSLEICEPARGAALQILPKTDFQFFSSLHDLGLRQFQSRSMSDEGGSDYLSKIGFKRAEPPQEDEADVWVISGIENNSYQLERVANEIKQTATFSPKNGVVNSSLIQQKVRLIAPSDAEQSLEKAAGIFQNSMRRIVRSLKRSEVQVERTTGPELYTLLKARRVPLNRELFQIIRYDRSGEYFLVTYSAEELTRKNLRALASAIPEDLGLNVGDTQNTTQARYIVLVPYLVYQQDLRNKGLRLKSISYMPELDEILDEQKKGNRIITNQDTSRKVWFGDEEMNADSGVIALHDIQHAYYVLPGMIDDQKYCIALVDLLRELKKELDPAHPAFSFLDPALLVMADTWNVEGVLRAWVEGLPEVLDDPWWHAHRQLLEFAKGFQKQTRNSIDSIVEEMESRRPSLKILGD